MSTSVGKAHLDLGLNYNQFNKDLNQIGPRSSKLLSGVFGKLGGLAAAAFGARMLFGFAKNAINLASDLTEVQNVVDVTFGEMAHQVNKFSKESLQAFGLSELSAKTYTSTMGAMLKSSGMAGQAVTDMSIEITKLSADMASFYNLSNEEAFNKIRSGISGETEPLKRLGINMNVANIEAHALSKGITKSYNAMSQSEQVMLRYDYLLKASADSQGDFARNANTWANQTKVLGEQFKILQATLGEGFIGILTPVVRGINVLISKLQIAANYFKAFVQLIFGKQPESAVVKTNKDIASSSGGAAGGLGKAGKAAKKAGKDMASSTSGLDELNNLMENTADNADDVGSGLDDMGAGGGGEVDFGSLDIGEIDLGEDEIYLKVEALVQGMKDRFNSFGDLTIVEDFKNIFSQIKSSFEEIWVPMKSILDINLSLMKTSFEGFKETIIAVFNSITQGVVSVLTPFISLVTGIIVTVLESIQEFLEKHGEDIRLVIIQAWELIRVGLTTIIDTIALVLKTIFEGLLTWWQENSEEVKAVLLGTWETIWLGLETVWNIIYEFAMMMFDGLKLFFEQNAQKISDTITAAWDLIWIIVSGVWTMLMKTAETIFNALKLFWEKWGDNILAFFSKVWEIMSAAFGIFLDFLTGAFKIFAKLFQGDWKGAWEETKKAGEKIWTGIKTLLSGIWDAIKIAASTIWDIIKTAILKIWDSIASGIKKTKDTLVNAVKEPFNIVKDWIGNLISDAFNWGKNLIGNIVDGIKSKISAVKDTVSEVADTIKNFLGFASPTKLGPGSSAHKWMPNFMDMMSDGIEGNIGNIKKAVGLAANELSSLGNVSLASPELVSATKSHSSSLSSISSDSSSSSDNKLVEALMEALRRLRDENDGDNDKIIENNLYLDGEVVYSNQQKIKASRGIDFGMGVFAR